MRLQLQGCGGWEASSPQAQPFIMGAPDSSSIQSQEAEPSLPLQAGGQCRWLPLLLPMALPITFVASGLQADLPPHPCPSKKGALDTLEQVSLLSRGFPTGARPPAGPGMATLVITLGRERSAAWKAAVGTEEVCVLRLCPVNHGPLPRATPAGVGGLLLPPGSSWARGLGAGVGFGGDQSLKAEDQSPLMASAPEQALSLCPMQGWGGDTGQQCCGFSHPHMTFKGRYLP